MSRKCVPKGTPPGGRLARSRETPRPGDGLRVRAPSEPTLGKPGSFLLFKMQVLPPAESLRVQSLVTPRRLLGKSRGTVCKHISSEQGSRSRTSCLGKIRKTFPACKAFGPRLPWGLSGCWEPVLPQERCYLSSPRPALASREPIVFLLTNWP